jgi:plastocyanin
MTAAAAPAATGRDRTARMQVAYDRIDPDLRVSRLPIMRPRRLLALPLALLLALAATAPAVAAERTVVVPGYQFVPAQLQLDVGDRVTWSFTDTISHTTTALRGQADYWDSDLKGPGDTFSRSFTRPGRFNYVCRPHSFMKGSITVGTDSVGDTVDAFKSRRSGSRVTVSFRLNEAANVTYKLAGPSRKTVRKGRLKAGPHSFRVKGLRDGSYAGTLTAVDDFRKKSKAKKSFVVR